MEYWSVTETAGRWNVTPRLVQKLCGDGRVKGAVRVGRIWMVPADTPKPPDLRRKSVGATSQAADAASEARPFPLNFGLLPDAQVLSAGEYAYFKGDFAGCVRLCSKAEDDPETRAFALSLAAAACINMGDFDGMHAAERRLTEIYAAAGGKGRYADEAEMAQAVISVSVYAPEHAPAWVSACDVSHLDERIRPYALYLCAKYAHSQGEFGRMLGIAEAALAFPRDALSQGVEIYLRLMAAIAASHIRMPEKAAMHVKCAVDISAAEGFIAPFAEHMTELKSIIEEASGSRHRDFYRLAKALWRQEWKNWIDIRYAIRESDVRLLLTLREYQAAQLKCGGLSNIEIAHRMGVSLRTANNALNGACAKLDVKSVEELTKYVV